MTAYVFPGQGSQTIGMGKSLFNEYPEIVQEANQILGFSIEALCLEDKDQKLNQTNFTQPALYTVNALSFMKKIKETNEVPRFVLGHSLGEYNALFAANAFDFATGLKLVKKRGELMSQAQGGGMAAIIGLKSDDINHIIQEHRLTQLSIANYNSYKQTIISGPKELIQSSESIFMERGAMLFMPLKVSGAFHSPFMLEAQQQFADFIRSFTFNDLTFPVISNATAKPYRKEDIQDYLVKQITSPVLWTQSIEYVLHQGETNFEELGPGKVLTNMIAKIRKGE